MLSKYEKIIEQRDYDKIFQKVEYEDIHVVFINLQKATLNRAGDFLKFMNRFIMDVPSNIIVDLEKCSLVDSTFLGALVKLQKMIVAENRGIWLIYNKLNIDTLFMITGMKRVFKTFPDLNEAISYFSSDEESPHNNFINKISISKEESVDDSNQDGTKLVDETSKEVLDSRNLETDSVSIPNMEGIEIEQGLSGTDGDKKLYKNLLNVFYKSNYKFTKEINDTYSKGDMTLALRMANILKVVSGNIGALDLHYASKELELDLSNNNGEQFEKILSSVNRNLNIVLTSIKENILGDSSAEKNKSSYEEFISRSTELKSLLENFDSEANKMIKDIGMVVGFEEEMKLLEQKVSEYNYEEAIELLSKIVDGDKIQ